MAMEPAALGAREAGKWGKTERRPRGFDSSPHLELGWSEAGCPRRRAEVGDGSYGGGAGAQEWRAGGGRRVVELEGDTQGLFIGGERRWRGGAPVAELGGH